MLTAVAMLLPISGIAQTTPVVPNGNFEQLSPGRKFPDGWTAGTGADTNAKAEVDTDSRFAGHPAIKMQDATPTQAYKYLIVNSDWIAVEPETTYVVHAQIKGKGVGRLFMGASLEGNGEYRQPVPAGDYTWQPVTLRVTAPANCNRLNIQFVADGVTEAFWFTSVKIEKSPVQLSRITEQGRTGPWKEWFPHTPGTLPHSLITIDISHENADVCGMLTALQGIVNRSAPTLYLINPTNPADQDTLWLKYLQTKGYTGAETRIATPLAAIAHFKSRISGAVVWDPDLPGSRHAAWMIGGIKNALPVSPEVAAQYKLPIIEDLRGRWHRNVDAYKYVYKTYWSQMSHRAIAWEHPLSNALTSRDTMVQQKIFMFWVSSYTDGEKGADPNAEREFVEELLAATPGNVPVMGWPMYGGKGIDEYAAVRLLSEYAKWVPGTGFSSNVTVHSAVHPASTVFQHAEEPPAKPAETQKALYLSVNIMDSGDAHWYWQLYQRGIWADVNRGKVPCGYGMNVTIVDTLPAVAQWYYEHRTPAESFFGLLYMNAPVYASRYRKEERERLWAEYVQLFDRYRRQLGMSGIEIYNGGNGGPSASTELLQRFTRGMPGLKYILADMGRHNGITADNSTQFVEGVPVFHTLTNFQVWSGEAEVANRKIEQQNGWLAGEITANAPKVRPGFMSAMAISWNYNATWLADLWKRLPADFKAVTPSELAARAKAAQGAR